MKIHPRHFESIIRDLQRVPLEDHDMGLGESSHEEMPMPHEMGKKPKGMVTIEIDSSPAGLDHDGDEPEAMIEPDEKGPMLKGESMGIAKPVSPGRERRMKFLEMFKSMK